MASTWAVPVWTIIAVTRSGRMTANLPSSRVERNFVHPLDRDCSRLEPFERARTEIEFVSGLRVGGAAQARRVIDAVGARSRQSFLIGDLKRFRRPTSACERLQPYALRARVVVNDVVGTRSTFKRRDRSGCGVFDMDETRHALAGADDRHLLPANLLAHITVVCI